MRTLAIALLLGVIFCGGFATCLAISAPWARRGLPVLLAVLVLVEIAVAYSAAGIIWHIKHGARLSTPRPAITTL